MKKDLSRRILRAAECVKSHKLSEDYLFNDTVVVEIDVILRELNNELENY